MCRGTCVLYVTDICFYSTVMNDKCRVLASFQKHWKAGFRCGTRLALDAGSTPTGPKYRHVGAHPILFNISWHTADNSPFSRA